MTGQSIAQLPLLLRREAFGGLLFVPQDAVHIELDPAAYAFVREHLESQRQPQTDEEAALLRQIVEQMGGAPAPRAEAVDLGAPVAGLPFEVYSAPTLADFQITTRCELGCPHCYAASRADGAEVALEDVERVLVQLRRNGVTQIAIGGGEPLSHPDFVQVLELCHQHNLVPNLTSNGLRFDADRLAAMKRLCGAVALSLEGVGDRFSRTRSVGFDFFQERLATLLESGISSVLQVTLSQANFGELDEIVDFCLQQRGLYGVIFLAYKEVGRGCGFDQSLAALPPDLVHARLRDAFLRLSKQTRVGYDCCLTPGIVGVEADLCFAQHDQLEGCSALRSSVGIMANLDVVPCTFTPELAVGNLRREDLFDIWRGAGATGFRQGMAERLRTETACASCAQRDVCLAGCPVFDLVRCAVADDRYPITDMR